MIIHDLEQNSDEWLKKRAGIPTASEFSKLVTGLGKSSDQLSTYAATLAANMYAGKDLKSFTGNEYTERGHELEPQARKAYEFTRDLQTELVGFITDDEESYGCSPDALVEEDGILELKNLKTENHVKMILYYNKNGKPEPKYIPQSQGQLFITGRAWVDLMFYHPDLPELVIRIERDLVFQSILKKRIEKVIQKRDEILKILQET